MVYGVYPMLRSILIPGATVLTLAAITSCSPCPAGDDLDAWLEQSGTCGVQVDPTPRAPACTPAPNTICTVVGTGVAGLGTDNVRGVESKTYLPQDVAIARTGIAYYSDWNNHQIRSLDMQFVSHTIAGSGELNDGDATEDPQMMPTNEPQVALHHRLNHPTSISFDASDNLLIAAWHSSQIKRVDLNTGILFTIVGTGIRGFGGDGGNAATAVLNLPVAVEIGPDGNMYIADQVNQRIRRVDQHTNVITTIVGDGMRGYAGDNGPATACQLNNPVGQAAAPAGRIAFDATGNLYIADTGNNRVRRVDQQGMITTVAGVGTAGFSGDGGLATAAEINAPADVAVGSDGTLYIADTQNSCVRAVAPDGVIRTVAGRCGMRGFSGDTGMPTDALLNRPYGIGVDGNSNLWIADTYNQRIRLVCSASGGARCGMP